MPDKLPLPAELLHLVEKREKTDRRQTQRGAKAEPLPKPVAGERRRATRRKSRRGKSGS